MGFIFMHISDKVIIQFKSLIKMNIFSILFLTLMSVIAIKECMARHLLVEIQHTYGREFCLTEGSLHCNEKYPCCEGLHCSERFGKCQKNDSAQNMLVALPNITRIQPECSSSLML